VISSENIADGSITLTTRNDIVRRINQEELDGIELPAVNFTAKVNGIFDPRLFPTSLDLKLKVGAQVMLLRNDPQRRYVNGTIGKIVELTEKEIKVLLYNQDEELTISLERETWEMIRYSYDDKQKNIKSDVIGSFEQWPVNLAWAITIHKSQGKTFQKVYLDMGSGAFEYGQTYVALSRCTTLEGLQLKRPLKPSDIMTDERINDFYNEWR
jgi:ATP-dependent exoDNAse (exonuclease V) alpha subunit